MPRKARRSIGGLVYHVLNRGNSRRRLFYSDRHYLAFFQVLAEALEHWPASRRLGLEHTLRPPGRPRLAKQK